MKTLSNGLTRKNNARIFRLFMVFLALHDASIQWCVSTIKRNGSINKFINGNIPTNWLRNAFTWMGSKVSDSKSSDQLYWYNINREWMHTDIYPLLFTLLIAHENGLSIEEYNEAVSNMLDIMTDPDYESTHKPHSRKYTQNAIDRYILWGKTPQGWEYWERIYRLYNGY